jgi:hypothetical protein
MHEFESFVYLDMEKTGSTFISSVLRKFCAEKEISRKTHGRIGAEFDPGKFYFISVRHPLQAYLSLYSYGCQSSGKLRARFEKMGLDKFYDGTTEGFADWLSFVLKPRNADVFGNTFAEMGDGAVARLIGLQSYRYLRLAMPRAHAVLSKCESRQDLRAAYASAKLPTFAVRHETIVDDLCTLLEGKLRHAISDLDKALHFVRSSKPVNASARVDSGEAEFVLDGKLQRRLRNREWFLYELCGY